MTVPGPLAAALVALVVSVPACAGSGAPSAPAGSAPLTGVKVRLAEIARVDRPTALVPRAGSTDLYVAEQGGRVRVIRVPKGGGPGTGAGTDPPWRVDPTDALDLSGETAGGGERGLLGIAFSPDGRRLYTYYTDLQGSIRIVEFPMRGDVADTTARRDLLSVQHPSPLHNGGALTFGPDGFLYIGTGDGGLAGDPTRNAQNTHSLLGKVLRIDPTVGRAPYSTPPDNPFADGLGGAPEVWLYGVRNPWRISFDRSSGDLWIGDVGQSTAEEVDRLAATGSGVGAGRGANLGWNLVEGTHPFEGGRAPAGATAPIFEYSHDGGNCSIIGGFVYRGSAIAALAGTYLFGDYCVGDIRGLLQPNGSKLEERSVGAVVPGGSMTSFGQDNDGELYVLSGSAAIYRLVPA